jgi:hypothetical protein
VVIQFNTIVFDLSSLVSTNREEPTQQASRLPHLPTTVQITVSPVELCLSFPEADCVAVLWSAVTLCSNTVLPLSNGSMLPKRVCIV